MNSKMTFLSGLAALGAAAALTGCETLSQDLTLLTKQLAPPSPSQAATMMTDPYNPDLRREGTVLIANSIFGGDPVYVDFYRRSVDEEDDPTVLAVSIRALARFGRPEDAPAIAARLNHVNEQVRWEAAKGLQRLHNPAAVTPLLNVLRNPEEATMVRVAAAHALGQYPQDRVFQALLSALDSRHLSLNLTAEQSLTTLTGQSLGLDLRDWSRWYNAQPVEGRFAERQDYFFPTYTRNRTLFERLAFWSSGTFEQPGVPAGLDSLTRRRTYDDPEPSTAQE